MTYTIGEFAEKTGLSTHTLRYYEKEGLLYSINRKSNGLREFSDKDLSLLNIILCLKATGMSIGNIKQYVNMCKEGKETENARKEIFVIQKQHIEAEINKLNSYLETVDYKIWYYENLAKLGNEEDPQNCEKMRNIYDSQNNK